MSVCLCCLCAFSSSHVMCIICIPPVARPRSGLWNAGPRWEMTTSNCCNLPPILNKCSQCQCQRQCQWVSSSTVSPANKHSTFFFSQSLPSLELYITVTSSRTLNLLIAYSHKRTVLGAEIEYGNTIPEITVTGYQLIAPAARPRFSLFASPALSLICIQHHSIHPSTTTTATNTFLHFGNSS